MGDKIERIIGEPTVFTVYAFAVVAVYAATYMLDRAFVIRPFLQKTALLYLASLLLTNLWQGVVASDLTFVLLFIDLGLLAFFYQHLRRTNSVLAKHLIWIHLLFIVSHVWGTFADRPVHFLGDERSPAWIEAFWRNRVFDLSLLYVLLISLARITLVRSKRARRWLGQLHKNIDRA